MEARVVAEEIGSESPQLHTEVSGSGGEEVETEWQENEWEGPPAHRQQVNNSTASGEAWPLGHGGYYIGQRWPKSTGSAMRCSKRMRQSG